MSQIAYAKELYSKTALLKAAYSFTDRAYLHLDADDTNYLVTITAKDGCDPVTQEEFDNEMLCQSLRHEVYLQTKTIRELLVARSMASTMIETAPAEDVAEDFSEQEDAILADWFGAGDEA